jgi:hypothetical protein
MVTLFGSYYVTPPPRPKLLDVNSLPLQVTWIVYKKMDKMQFQSQVQAQSEQVGSCGNIAGGAWLISWRGRWLSWLRFFMVLLSRFRLIWG